MRPRILRVGALLLLLFADAGRAAAETAVYRYDVLHPEHGHIGEYVNTIVRNGDVTEVENRLSVEIRMLGISAYAMEAKRRERWRGGRLIAYEGVTQDNGEVIRIEGRAEGDRFFIEGPDGQTAAPADVLPTNPWNLRFREARVLMATQTGRLDRVQVARGRDTWIELDGQRVRARHYTARGRHRYDVWFGPDGVPLRFALAQGDSRIVAVLADQSAVASGG